MSSNNFIDCPPILLLGRNKLVPCHHQWCLWLKCVWIASHRAPNAYMLTPYVCSSRILTSPLTLGRQIKAEYLTIIPWSQRTATTNFLRYANASLTSTFLISVCVKECFMGHPGNHFQSPGSQVLDNIHSNMPTFQSHLSWKSVLCRDSYDSSNSFTINHSCSRYIWFQASLPIC